MTKDRMLTIMAAFAFGLLLGASLFSMITTIWPRMIPVKASNHIEVVLMALDSDSWYAYKNGLEQAGIHIGVDVSISAPPTEESIAEQLTLIERAIERKPKTLILAPCDPVAVLPLLKRAKDSGIEIVLFDSDVEDKSYRDYFTGISNYNAAKTAAEYLDVSDDVKVLILCKNLNATDHRDRMQGFIDGLPTGADITIKEVYNDSRNQAHSIVMDVAYKNVDIIYCTAAYIVGGAVAAEPTGRIIGFDNESENQSYLDEGKQYMIIDQNLYNIGYAAVANSGKGNKQDIEIEVALITK